MLPDIGEIFIPLLEKLYNQDPAGEPFRHPVDVEKYECWDYYEHIKHPIDLTTIRNKLTNHDYKDAWGFISDIQLMFTNAHSFNRKGTRVYDYTNRLSKIWNTDLPPIMQRLNYCCGTLHSFGPQLLFCHGTTTDKYCQIPIGAKYRCYEDKYSFCLPCFEKIETEQVNIQDTRFIEKDDFVECTNDNWQYERFIECTQCARRLHQICELYPACEDEITKCTQMDKLDMLCQNPEQDRSGAAQKQSNSEQELDDDLMQMAQTVDDSHSKNSVDNIAARLLINNNKKMTAQGNAPREPKFTCNHCYRRKKIGFDLRHRKYSPKRLPHTRMSRYIETKVNEHIRENSPSAGEVTVRVLAAYRDIILVKKEMREYVKKSREDLGPQHPNSENYPDEFGYTNRAIFAWQEIDGVDVCVFGMHVQEYGEDCPEPDRQVVYLSYLDSVHFFRPKQVRTAIYHEILLSYFKYVKKLGFRRVFIWVCPSRKGDDYIFYRHPTEQKMPTLKRLLNWYINLLDKGILAGIIERHQNIHQYANSENWNSILSMPYLSGDYWPGEFERLINLMNGPNQSDSKEETDITVNFERSLRAQRESFIVAKLSDCDCSPHFENQRRKEEATFTCDLMKGREPFLLLARQRNYEFSTLRRAKFSSLAMVKHLGQSFKLDPICNECYSFDSSKRHYSCPHCEDYYLCTSCHEYAQHEHIMSPMAPIVVPDIDDFIQQCSIASTTNSISSASSTISNKSFIESSFEVSISDSVSRSKRKISTTSTPINSKPTKALKSGTMPLSQRQRNREFYKSCLNRTEDEGNAEVHSFSALPKQPTPPPSHTANDANLIELDQVLVENFIRQAEISYAVDFDQMKNESRRILAHYWNCPFKETCHRCKFVVLSCSFMSVLMRSTLVGSQNFVNCNNPSENLPNNASNTNHLCGIDLTTAHRLSYQPKDK